MSHIDLYAPGDGWDGVYRSLPFDLQDVHLSSGWAKANAGDAARLMVMPTDEGMILRPFRIVNEDGEATVDTTSIGYGGTITTALFPQPDVAAAFDTAWLQWAESLGAVTDFALLNPALAQHQLALYRGPLVPERTVNIVQLTSAEHGIPPAIMSHGRMSDLAGFEGEIKEVETDLFAGGYSNMIMERDGAVGRWARNGAYFRLLKDGLGEKARFFAAIGADGLPSAGALFLAGGATAHYHLAWDTRAHPGAPTALVVAGARWAYTVGAAFLCLGGGLVDGDGLDQFKASFGAMRRTVYSSRRILRTARYRELTDGLAPTKFFPPYREAKP